MNSLRCPWHEAPEGWAPETAENFGTLRTDAEVRVLRAELAGAGEGRVGERAEREGGEGRVDLTHVRNLHSRTRRGAARARRRGV